MPDAGRSLVRGTRWMAELQIVSVLNHTADRNLHDRAPSARTYEVAYVEEGNASTGITDLKTLSRDHFGI